MKNQDLERLLAASCADQRADLKSFADTGDEDALARIHFDSCPDCDSAVEKIIELRDGLPPAPAGALMTVQYTDRERAVAIAGIGLICALMLALVASVGYIAYAAFSGDAEAKTAIARLDRRIVFVRLPGHPEVCVSALRGKGGYGPRYLGASRCDAVKDRVESDEDLAWHLRGYVVAPMRDTSLCLVQIEDGADRFTVPCATFD